MPKPALVAGLLLGFGIPFALTGYALGAYWGNYLNGYLAAGILFAGALVYARVYLLSRVRLARRREGDRHDARVRRSGERAEEEREER